MGVAGGWGLRGYLEPGLDKSLVEKQTPGGMGLGALAAGAEDDDENASAIPEDVCVLNLDLGTLQVPPLEPLERFP